MNKWNELSMAEKAAFIKTAVNNNITDLSEIINSYNSFADGGYLDNLTSKPFSYAPIPEVRYADGGRLYAEGGPWLTHLPINTQVMRDFLFNGFPKHFVDNQIREQAIEAQEPSEAPLTYETAPDAMKMFLSKSLKKGKDTYSISDPQYPVIEKRYLGITQAMKDEGFNPEDIARLAPFLTIQNVLEGGYLMSKDNNNFGGILDPTTRKQMEFASEQDFYKYYINNLDEHWGDDYLGKGKGWRNAKTLQEYADIINREDLGLHTLEDFNKYNREHKDKPAYLYTPLWENNNTDLMSAKKFGGIEKRVNSSLELRQNRIDEFNKKYNQK